MTSLIIGALGGWIVTLNFKRMKSLIEEKEEQLILFPAKEEFEMIQETALSN
jgi:hypothetical protein